MIHGEIIKLDFGSQNWRIHEVSTSRPWSFPEHRHHGFCDLMLVCEGSLRQEVNGKPLDLQAGDLTWIRETDRHILRGDRLRYLNINLPGERLRLSALSVDREREYDTLLRRTLPPVVALGQHLPRLREEWSRLFHLQGSAAGNLIFHNVMTGALIELLLPLVGTKNKERDLPPWLEDCLTHIHQQIEEGVGLADLPRVCRRSPEHISRSFSRYLGLSPSGWINQQRLGRAALLLAATNRDISDIGYSIGFNNLSYFYRLFRRVYGVPPLVYRRTYNPVFQQPGSVTPTAQTPHEQS